MMKKQSTITDEQIEMLLQEKGVPVAPSSDFVDCVEAALSEDVAFESWLKEKCVPVAPSVDFEKRVLAGTILENTAKFDFKKVSRVLAGTAAVAAVAATGVLSFRGNEAIAPDLAPEYQLVSNENVLSEIDESLEAVLQADGTVVLPTRYVYTNTQRWQDANSSKQIVSSEKHEEIVPVVFAVY